MKVPSKVSPEQFAKEANERTAQLFGPDGLKILCRKCHSEAKAVTLYVSIHTSLFTDCAGGGDVVHVYVPYCPNCETIDERDRYTCVHVGPGQEFEQALGLREAIGATVAFASPPA